MQGMVFMIMKQYQDDSSDLEGLDVQELVVHVLVCPGS